MPLGVVLELLNQFRLYMREVPLEVEVAAWLLQPVRGFGYEPLFVNSKKVVRCFFIIIFAVIDLAKTPAAHPPNRAFGDSSAALVFSAIWSWAHRI